MHCSSQQNLNLEVLYRLTVFCRRNQRNEASAEGTMQGTTRDMAHGFERRASAACFQRNQAQLVHMTNGTREEVQ